jgi:tRNA modification GTPase
MTQTSSDKVTCAVVSPLGRAAVATVRVVGSQSWERVRAVLTSRFSAGQLPLDRIVVGRWRDEQRQAASEQVVVARLDEQTIEIHCHGGQAAVHSICQSLVDRACQPVTWQDTVRTSTQNQIQQEALIALAGATTEKTASLLLRQYAGALDECLQGVSRDLDCGALDSAANRLQDLVDTSDCGLRIVDPFRVVICGPPNVGKSSLINALAGFDRSIVFDEPGTTRDVLQVDTAIGGWPVQLLDTAGLRDTEEHIESLGIERALTQAEQADLVVLVSSAADPWDDTMQAWLDRFPAALLVHNKTDLATSDQAVDPGARPNGLSTSVTQGTRIDQLLLAIRSRLVPRDPSPTGPLIFTARQAQLAQDALLALRRGNFDMCRDRCDQIR